MAGELDKKATVEEVDSWFSSTPQEDRIPRLADTIWDWGEEDLSKLKLDERLSQEEIVELLQVEVEMEEGDAVIHLLVYFNQTSTLVSLLDRVTPQHLLSLFRLRGHLGLNVLGWALGWSSLPILPYVKRLSIDELYNLLCEEVGLSGEIQLYGAVWRNVSISEVLSLLQDETRVHHLLSIRDDEGLSVLSYSIYWGSEETFQSIIRHYTGKQAELLELAAITDNEGNTSFHYAAGQETSDYLTDLIKATCSLETRRELANVLSIRNDSGGKKKLGDEVEECHSDNEIIYNWAFDSLTNHRYLLFDFPSTLIMYNTVDRPGADEEAKSLEKCFNDLGIKVKAKNSFTKKKLFDTIKDHQMEASRNGQILALMSHGTEGYITDSEGEQVPLKKIEDELWAGPHSSTPKLLILQCCQGKVEGELQPRESRQAMEGASSSAQNQWDAGGTGQKYVQVHEHHSYAPTHPNVAALVSTGPGKESERNKFIPKLAEAITSMATKDGISRLMYMVKGQFPDNKHGPTPFLLDGLKFEFCLKSVLPIYLKSKKTHKRPVDPEPKTIQKRRKR